MVWIEAGRILMVFVDVPFPTRLTNTASAPKPNPITDDETNEETIAAADEEAIQDGSTSDESNRSILRMLCRSCFNFATSSTPHFGRSARWSLYLSTISPRKLADQNEDLGHGIKVRRFVATSVISGQAGSNSDCRYN